MVQLFETFIDIYGSFIKMIFSTYMGVPVGMFICAVLVIGIVVQYFGGR